MEFKLLTFILLVNQVLGLPFSDQDLPIDLEDEAYLVEGDILKPKFASYNLRSNLWENATVPFIISSDFDTHDLGIIAGAMSDYYKYTCIKFVRRTTEQDYVSIIKGGGCYSYVGKIGGRQYLSLGDGCVVHSIVQHELMHALGAHHEHTRPDRDSYVEIKFQNVKSNGLGNFALARGTSTYGPYDYCSVMHYSETAFSKNGEPTIIPKKQETLYCGRLGQGVALSNLDIETLRHMYQCQGNFPSYHFCDHVRDKTLNCLTWKDNGYCTTYKNAMAWWCPVSCGICSSDQ